MMWTIPIYSSWSEENYQIIEVNGTPISISEQFYFIPEENNDDVITSRNNNEEENTEYSIIRDFARDSRKKEEKSDGEVTFVLTSTHWKQIQSEKLELK